MLILLDLAGIAFLLTVVSTPFVRDTALRLRLTDAPDGSRKAHRGPVPRLGGVAIAFAYLAALLAVFYAPYRALPFDVDTAWDAAWRLSPAALVIFLTGLVDDLVGLRPIQKIFGQAIAALIAYWAGFGVSFFRGEPLESWIGIPVTILWLVGCSNALNLIDGLDGLAAGVGFFATATMMVAALTHDQIELAMVTAPMLGALLGFLRYNFNPASIFLGDSGSLLIGFLLGCYGAVWTHKSATILGMTAPLIALSLPLLDTGLAIVRRFLRRQPIFTADRGHIHHKLLDMGWTPRRVALVLYGACGLAAAGSLMHDAFQDQFGGVVVVLFCAAAWLGVQHLGYAEFGMASRMILGGQLRGMIDVQMRLQAFERTLGAAKDAEDLWQRLERGRRDFQFAGVQLQIGERVWTTPDTDRGDDGLWRLYAPLGAEGGVTFYRKPSARMHPIVLSEFAKAVERAVRHWIWTRSRPS